MDKPVRCIDPILKHCQDCPYGWIRFPKDIEIPEDLYDCNFEFGCTLGFDKGRPEDEPTEEEWRDFQNKLDHLFNNAERRTSQ